MSLEERTLLEEEGQRKGHCFVCYCFVDKKNTKKCDLIIIFIQSINFVKNIIVLGFE